MINKKSFFLIKIPCRIMIYLEEKTKKVHVSKMIREIEISTYGGIHTTKKLIKLGLIEFDKSDGKKYIRLSRKGREIAKSLYNICSLI